MKKNFLYIIVSLLLLTTSSCNNDFLNDNIEPQEDLISSDSQIIITPLWDTADYQFTCANVGNADFKVVNTPEWLEVETTTGKLTAIQQPDGIVMLYQQSVGTMRCKAKVNPEYEKTGMYLDNIEISVNGKICYVPVMYVSEGNPKINVSSTFTINSNNYDYPYFSIQNTGEGILLWEVISMPEWLTINMNVSSVFIPQESSQNIHFTFNSNSLTSGNLTGTIVLKTNDKDKPEVSINVTADIGNPEIYLWLDNNQIDFGATATTYSLYISAWGSGLLVWHFEELPEWLTITPSSGVRRTHTSYEDLIFTCDRSKLQPGVNSSVIYLKSNADRPSIAITVTARAPGDNTNIRALEGNIVDAAFDKNTNTLCYVTSQPNKLVVYDVTTRSVLREIALSKAPTCLAVSEDFTKAAVGHGGNISAVDLKSYTVTKTIGISDVVYDIVWAQDNLFCYTVEYSYSYYLSWVDTDNGTVTKKEDNSMYGGSILKKVPSQPYVIATRQWISPSGILVYSTSTKSLKSYAHQDLYNFWLSEDGKYIFRYNGEIYRTATATDSNDTFNAYVNSIGQLQVDYFMPSYVEHSISAHKIWAIGNINYSGSSNIYQFNDNNFAFQKSFFYSDVFQPNTQTNAFEVQAHYLFANGAGTELSVLRKGTNNNNWSIEFIQVTN